MIQFDVNINRRGIHFKNHQKKKMSNKLLPPLPQSPTDEKFLNDESEKKGSTNHNAQVATSNHPHLTAVKGVISDAVNNAAQALKTQKESHPEAYHQDGKTGPE